MAISAYRDLFSNFSAASYENNGFLRWKILRDKLCAVDSICQQHLPKKGIPEDGRLPKVNSVFFTPLLNVHLSFFGFSWRRKIMDFKVEVLCQDEDLSRLTVHFRSALLIEALVNQKPPFRPPAPWRKTKRSFRNLEANYKAEVLLRRNFEIGSSECFISPAKPAIISQYYTKYVFLGKCC